MIRGNELNEGVRDVLDAVTAASPDVAEQATILLEALCQVAGGSGLSPDATADWAAVMIPRYPQWGVPLGEAA